MGNSQTSTTAVYVSSGLAVSDAPAFASSVRTFPNPATNTLTISFESDRTEHAAISLLDMTGRTVATAADQDFAAGSHTVSLDVRKLPAAVYALNIRTADGRRTTRRAQVL